MRDHCLYIAIDGDDVGQRLEHFVLTNDIDGLITFSRAYQSRVAWLSAKLSSELRATILFCAGDSLLASMAYSCSAAVALDQVRKEFADGVERTLSIGIGSTPREAYLALKLAKLSGKNQLKRFEELSNE
jgi:hypothetical protein